MPGKLVISETSNLWAVYALAFPCLWDFANPTHPVKHRFDPGVMFWDVGTVAVHGDCLLIADKTIGLYRVRLPRRTGEQPQAVLDESLQYYEHAVVVGQRTLLMSEFGHVGEIVDGGQVKRRDATYSVPFDWHATAERIIICDESGVIEGVDNGSSGFEWSSPSRVDLIPRLCFIEGQVAWFIGPLGSSYIVFNEIGQSIEVPVEIDDVYGFACLRGRIYILTVDPVSLRAFDLAGRLVHEWREELGPYLF